MSQKPPKLTAIEDLYPDFSPEEQREARENFDQYLSVVKRIYERLEREGKLEEALKEIRKHRDEQNQK
jgi:hypothetical protein